MYHGRCILFFSFFFFFYRIFGFRCARDGVVYTHQIRTRLFFVNRYLYSTCPRLPVTVIKVYKTANTSNYLAPVKGQRVVVICSAYTFEYRRLTSRPVPRRQVPAVVEQAYIYKRHVLDSRNPPVTRHSQRQQSFNGIFFHGKIKTTGLLRSKCTV